jgi:hypothetical protein
MLDRSGIGSDVVAQNSIPDDPYQPLGEEDQAFVSRISVTEVAVLIS